MTPVFQFRNNTLARKFQKEMRKAFILTKLSNDCKVEVFLFSKIKDEEKERVMNLANKIYNEING